MIYTRGKLYCDCSRHGELELLMVDGRVTGFYCPICFAFRYVVKLEEMQTHATHHPQGLISQ
jgi:hypothetical protein